MSEANRATSYSEALHERVERDGISALTKPERMLLTLEEFGLALISSDYEVMLLEIVQLKPDELLESLAEIEAVKTREIVAAAVLAIRESHPVQIAEIKRFLSSAAGVRFSSIVTRLQKLPENIRELAVSYADRNHESLLGPKTQLELWQSRRGRGAASAKRRVTVKLSTEAETERDESFSTRKCPVCAYPSPDYRKTCKACGFPHGRRSEA